MTFQITGLNPDGFVPLFQLSERALAERGIITLEAEDGDYPCRISLRHAPVGDRLLLLNHMHQPMRSPYRSSHAIYVSKSASEPGRYVDEIPPIMVPRTLSIRAFDATHMMIDADIVEGRTAHSLIERLLAETNVAYLHVHFAKRGCFAARVQLHE